MTCSALNKSNTKPINLTLNQSNPKPIGSSPSLGFGILGFWDSGITHMLAD